MSVKKFVSPFLAAMLCAGTTVANVETKVMIGERGNKIAYVVSVPDDYETSKKVYPFLIHLHGHGGQGSDLKGMGGPLGSYWRENCELVAIFPQCLKGLTWWHPEMLDAMMAVVQREGKKLRVDPDRVYITGQSMGGYGSYNMAMRFPDVFAAVAPISGASGGSGSLAASAGIARRGAGSLDFRSVIVSRM